jgi:hypothetical protein
LGVTGENSRRACEAGPRYLLRFFAYSWDAHIKYDVCTTRESLEESTDPEPQFSGQVPRRGDDLPLERLRVKEWGAARGSRRQEMRVIEAVAMALGTQRKVVPQRQAAPVCRRHHKTMSAPPAQGRAE